jgi:hypothetical protein
MDKLIQDVADALRCMVGCQRWKRDESFPENGVEVSTLEHDRARW